MGKGLSDRNNLKGTDIRACMKYQIDAGVRSFRTNQTILLRRSFVSPFSFQETVSFIGGRNRASDLNLGGELFFPQPLRGGKGVKPIPPCMDKKSNVKDRVLRKDCHMRQEYPHIW